MAKKKVSRHKPTVRGARPLAEAGDVTPHNEAFFSTLEKQAEEGFERLFVRLIWRLGLVARKDVTGLSQRVGALERRLRVQRPSRLRVVPRKPAPPSSRGSSDNSAA